MIVLPGLTVFRNNTALQWLNAGAVAKDVIKLDGSNNLLLSPAGGNIAYIQNGTGACELQVYGNTSYIGMLHNGTNAGIYLINDGIFYLGTNGNSGRWNIGASASGYTLYPGTDNLGDIGKTINRVASIHLAVSVNVGIVNDASITSNVGVTPFYGAANPTSATLGALVAYGANTSGAELDFFKTRNTATAAGVGVNNSDVLMSLSSWADCGNAYLNTARIQMVVDGTYTANQRPPTRIELYSNAANTALALALAIKSDQSIQLAAKISQYAGVTSAGWGVPAVYAAARSVAQTAAVASVATYTCGAADGSFEISANVLVTVSTAHSFSVQCDYTDEGNTARTVTFNIQQLGGTLVTAITNVTGVGPYEGVTLHIRCKASTAITIKTTGTFTTVTYNVEGNIRQIA